jgi:hypothetical protein
VRALLRMRFFNSTSVALIAGQCSAPRAMVVMSGALSHVW